MNIKRIRKEILSSVMSLFLCGTMLIGATLAWFTSTAVSGDNIIKAGNLGVSFQYANGTENPSNTTWLDASNTQIFNSNVWEPGYTDVKHIKISNTGKLALKYKVNIVPTGDVSKLADVIDVYFIDGGQQITNGDTLNGITPIGTLAEVIQGIELETTSTIGDLNKEENDIITIALKMQETAGNAYQNLSIGDNFDIQVVATQNTVESDSFNNQYDKDAEYPVIGEIIEDGLYYNKNTETYSVTSAEGLNSLNEKMLSNSKIRNKDAIIKLESDIDFAGYTWKEVDVHTDSGNIFKEIDGNGYTIKNMKVDGRAMFKRIACSNDVVIKNITFDNANVSADAINVALLSVQNYTDVLLDNVDVKNSSFTGRYKVAPLIGTVYNEKTSTTVTTIKNCDVSNCTVKSTKYDFCTTGMVAFVNAGDNDKVIFENSTVSDVKLYAPYNSGYDAHAWIYTEGSGTLYNQANGVTVKNCKFTNF